MSLDRRFRAAFYAMLALLFASGALWLAASAAQEAPGAGPWANVAATLLMLHGAAAMAMLMLFGALFPLHVLASWRYRANRTSGTAMLAADLVLIVTAFGLYYFGAETLRAWTSDIHIAVGLALPALLLAHVVHGKRETARRRSALAEAGVEAVSD